MPSTRTAEALARRISEILARGVTLSPEVLRFIEATFSNPSTGELAAILADESNGERDSLLELLFSPDEPIQLELEEFLALHSSEAVDAGRVVEILCRTVPSVAFVRPEGDSLMAAITPALALRFVRQLRIDRPIPPPIAAVIDSQTNGKDRLRLRMLVRSARFDFTPSKVEFLSRLIAQAGLEGEAGRDCFAFALELLAEIELHADIERALTQRKKLLIKALTRARQQQEELASANFETLVSRGLRLAWVDEDAVRRDIGYLDRISLAVFGRIVHFEPTGAEDTLELGTSQDITDLLRRLG
jgi:hypothetical protein